MTRRMPVLAAILAAGLTLAAQAATLPKRYLAAKDVKRGMTGYGLSVFRGTTIDKFEVEVLGVLRNRMPKQDMILARMKGAGLEKTGIVAGMSGSPIYLKVGKEHKLAGAIAYGWSFPKEPICGITPVENMYAVATSTQKPGRKAAAAGGKLDAPIVLGRRTIRDVRVAAGAVNWQGVPASSAVLYRLRTPLQVAGLAEPVLATVRKDFEALGFLPVQGGAVAGGADLQKVKLEPGAAISVCLAEGDIAMSGSGTVTDVIGNTVLAFGHPMFGEGRVSVPIATTAVHLSFASLVRSFKMSSPIRTVGRLTTDAQAGVVGKLGEFARMIPLEARLRRADLGGGEEVYRCRVLEHPSFTSRLVGTFFVNCLVVRGGFPRENTVTFRATVHLKGHKPLQLENVYSGLRSLDGISKAVSDIVGRVGALSSNPFGQVRIERITANIDLAAQETTAGVESVRLERNEYRPGETIRALATLRTFKKEAVLQTLELKLPEDFPPGVATVAVCDAATSHGQDRSEAPHRYQPRTLDGLIANVRVQTSNRRLYIRMKLPDRGVAFKGVELPSLPASMFAVIATQKVTGMKATGKSIKAHVDTPYVVKGNHQLKVLIRPREID